MKRNFFEKYSQKENKLFSFFFFFLPSSFRFRRGICVEVVLCDCWRGKHFYGGRNSSKRIRVVWGNSFPRIYSSKNESKVSSPFVSFLRFSLALLHSSTYSFLLLFPGWNGRESFRIMIQWWRMISHPGHPLEVIHVVVVDIRCVSIRIMNRFISLADGAEQKILVIHLLLLLFFVLLFHFERWRYC